MQDQVKEALQRHSVFIHSDHLARSATWPLLVGDVHTCQFEVPTGSKISFSPMV
jgi:hypothetical protein